MKRILIVKMSSMGDVIHTLPAVTDLSMAYPDVLIDWVVETSFADIPKWHPKVNRVIPLSFRKWRRRPFFYWRQNAWQSFYKQCCATHYDIIIDTQGLLKSALIARFAVGPSFGFDRASAKEPWASYLYDRTVFVKHDQHAIMRNRELFSKAFEYDLSPDAPIDYGVSVERSTIEADPYYMLIHASSREDKSWPEANWVQLANQLIANDMKCLLPWGSEQERERAERIAQYTGATVLPKLTLTQLKSLLCYARGAVAVDTGLGHLAAACATPTISLYRHTDPKKIGTQGLKQLHFNMENTDISHIVKTLEELTAR